MGSCGCRDRAAAPERARPGLVYAQIKERLLEGVFAKGERLQVEALKTEFRVSKQPVMDALRRLSGEGLVEIIPQVGCRVCSYPPREVEDFFRLFGAMDLDHSRWSGVS